MGKKWHLVQISGEKNALERKKVALPHGANILIRAVPIRTAPFDVDSLAYKYTYEIFPGT